MSEEYNCIKTINDMVTGEKLTEHQLTILSKPAGELTFCELSELQAMCNESEHHWANDQHSSEEQHTGDSVVSFKSWRYVL